MNFQYDNGLYLTTIAKTLREHLIANDRSNEKEKTI